SILSQICKSHRIDPSLQSTSRHLPLFNEINLNIPIKSNQIQDNLCDEGLKLESICICIGSLHCSPLSHLANSAKAPWKNIYCIVPKEAKNLPNDNNQVCCDRNYSQCIYKDTVIFHLHCIGYKWFL